MLRFLMVLVFSALVISTPPQALADETIDLLKEAIGLLEENDFTEVREVGANAPGGRKVRISGRTGSSVEDNGETTLNLSLKNGKTLIFTSRDLAREGVTDFAEEFPIAEVDTE